MDLLFGFSTWFYPSVRETSTLTHPRGICLFSSGTSLFLSFVFGFMSFNLPPWPPPSHPFPPQSLSGLNCRELCPIPAFPICRLQPHNFLPEHRFPSLRTLRQPPRPLPSSQSDFRVFPLSLTEIIFPPFNCFSPACLFL